MLSSKTVDGCRNIANDPQTDKDRDWRYALAGEEERTVPAEESGSMITISDGLIKLEILVDNDN